MSNAKTNIYIKETKNTWCVFNCETGEELLMLHKKQKDAHGNVVETLSESKARRLIDRHFPENEYYFKRESKKVDLAEEIAKEQVEQSETVVMKAPKSFGEELRTGSKIKDTASRVIYYRELLKLIPEDNPAYAKCENRIKYGVEALEKHLEDTEKPPAVHQVEQVEEQTNVNDMETQTKVFVKHNKAVHQAKKLVDWTAMGILTPVEISGQVVENVGRLIKTAAVKTEVAITHALKVEYYEDPETGHLIPVTKDEIEAEALDRVKRWTNAPITAPIALADKIKQALKRKEVEVQVAS